MTTNSNFYIILSEAHNKAGDLFFFKGRQTIPVVTRKLANDVDPYSVEEITRDARVVDFNKDADVTYGLFDNMQFEEEKFRKINELSEKTGLNHSGKIFNVNGPEGYLLRAHYHYAVGLHDIRRFIVHRRQSSSMKFNLEKELWRTILPGQWPKFATLAASNSITDLAESLLARVSFFGVFNKVSEYDHWIKNAGNEERSKPKEIARSLERMSIRWFEGDESHRESDLELSISMKRIETDEETLNTDVYDIFKLGKLSNWFGRTQMKPRYFPDQQLEFGKASSSMQRLVMSLNLSAVSARFFKRGGRPIDAAREFMQVAETVTHYMWWLCHMRSILKNNMEEARCSERREKVLQCPTCSDKGKCQNADFSPETNEKDFLQKLFVDWKCSSNDAYKILIHFCDMATFSLKEMSDLLLTREVKNEFSYEVTPDPNQDDLIDGKIEYHLGGTIPPSAMTLLCSLALATLNSPDAIRKNTQSMRIELYELLQKWVIPDRSFEENDETFSKNPSDLSRAWKAQREFFVTVLQNTLRRHSYPQLNRLNAFKVLADDLNIHIAKNTEVSSPDLKKKMALLGNYLSVLRQEENTFDAPLHFTPFQSGVTFAMAWINADHHNWPMDIKKDLLRNEALTRLNASRESYTMGRAYYENVSNLYYLYDDFNDRQIH